jgi:hypothetical protein
MQTARIESNDLPDVRPVVLPPPAARRILFVILHTAQSAIPATATVLGPVEDGDAELVVGEIVS